MEDDNIDPQKLEGEGQLNFDDCKGNLVVFNILSNPPMDPSTKVSQSLLSRVHE